MKLSAFMELLLISTHLVKSFHFFALHLLEIDQPLPKNSNYNVLLSAWSVSMEICPT